MDSFLEVRAAEDTYHLQHLILGVPMSESCGEMAIKPEEELDSPGSAEDIGVFSEKVHPESATEESEESKPLDLASKDFALDAPEGPSNGDKLVKEQVLPQVNLSAEKKELPSAEEADATENGETQGSEVDSSANLEAEDLNQTHKIECESESVVQSSAELVESSERDNAELFKNGERVDANGDVLKSVISSETGYKEDANSGNEYCTRENGGPCKELEAAINGSGFHSRSSDEILTQKTTVKEGTDHRPLTDAVEIQNGDTDLDNGQKKIQSLEAEACDSCCDKIVGLVPLTRMQSIGGVIDPPDAGDGSAKSDAVQNREDGSTQQPDDRDGASIAENTQIEYHTALLKNDQQSVDSEKVGFFNSKNHVLQQDYENELVPEVPEVHEGNKYPKLVHEVPSNTQLPNELIAEGREYLNTISQFVSSEVPEEGAEKVRSLNCKNHDRTYEKAPHLTSNIIVQFVSPEVSAENNDQESDATSQEQGSQRNELVPSTDMENQSVAHIYLVEEENHEKTSVGKDEINDEGGDLSTEAVKESYLIGKDRSANFEGRNQQGLQVLRTLEFDPSSIGTKSLSNHIGECFAKEAEEKFSPSLPAVSNKKDFCQESQLTDPAFTEKCLGDIEGTTEVKESPIQETQEEVKLGFGEYRDRKSTFTECCGVWYWIRGIHG